jgi:hypothetical protein
VSTDSPVVEPTGATGAVGWLTTWQGPGFQAGTTLVRGADPARLRLPAGDGVAASAAVVLDVTGAVRRILAVPDGPEAPAVLGFLDANTILVRAGSFNEFGLVAWTWATGELRLVSELTTVSMVSVALP